MSKNNGAIDQKKLSTFLTLTQSLRKDGAVLMQSGAWLVCDSPFKWAEAKEQIQAVKDAGFKSAFVRGNRIGVNVKDLAKAA